MHSESDFLLTVIEDQPIPHTCRVHAGRLKVHGSAKLKPHELMGLTDENTRLPNGACHRCGLFLPRILLSESGLIGVGCWPTLGLKYYCFLVSRHGRQRPRAEYFALVPKQIHDRDPGPQVLELCGTVCCGSISAPLKQERALQFLLREAVVCNNHWLIHEGELCQETQNDPTSVRT